MTKVDVKIGRQKQSTATLPPGSSSVTGDKTDVLSRENYKFLQQEIHRSCGIVFDEDKHYLFASRLAPVLRGAKLKTLNELCTQLRTGLYPELYQQVMEALTTSETFFFRDVTPFEALRTHLLPELMENSLSRERLRIWSAAASSGQEAYSIAILLKELGIQRRTADILGTDISEQVLAYAREAKYLQFEVDRGLPARYLAKYFKREGLGWRLHDEIRNMVRFRRFDLRQPIAGLGRFHIIFCRNVLIYFDLETRNRVTRQLYDSLEAGGYLILGAAESIQCQQYNCQRVNDTNTTIYQKQ